MLFWDMNTYDETERAFFDSLQTTQWLPKAELEAYQRRQLAHIVRHAAGTVPFYKDRLAPIVRADGSVDLSRWHEVPILKRTDLLERQSEMWSRDVPKDHGRILIATTSGSTGTPVHMKWTGLSRMARRVAYWRTYMWHDFDFTRLFAKSVGAAQWPEGAARGPWGPPWASGPLGSELTIEQVTTVPRLTEWLHRKQVGYFFGLSMLMPAIAEEAAHQGLKLDLACMIGFGMQASVSDREVVKEKLGIPIIEVYSSMDCGQIAHQCEAGSFHVLSELVLVEIVDDLDQPCPPGTDGRVIVTVLHGSAQPVIRYDLTDVAAFGGPCRCGRSLPVITPISGRMRHMFKFDGAPPFSPTDGVAYKILKPLLQPSWYQIAQTGRKSVEIRFVTKMPLDEGYQEKICTQMPALLRRSDISVTFKQFDCIPTLPGKKHIMFVNEYQNQE